MDHVAVKLEQDLAPMDEGNGEKQVKSTSMNQYDHGARGPSGVPLAFCTTLAQPFHSEGGVCLLSPLECEPRSLGLGKVAGRAP